MQYIKKTYDLVVIGGGVGGVITAITAARKGLTVALVDNKAGLGGNACSEIGVSIDGATFFGFFANMREAGPVEELKEELAKVDPFLRNTQGSSVMLFWCEQAGVTVYSELNIHGVDTEGRRLTAVYGSQGGTERDYHFGAEQFVDATGDGTVAALAGCEFRTGREGQTEFNEILAPEKPDSGIMGASLLFRASEKKEPSSFVRPSWAYEYKSPDDLPFRIDRGTHPVDMGFWWIEYAGDHNDPIGEYESIRKELLKCVYGVWAYYKNDPARNMANYALDTVSITPAKRESRRIVGDVILTERDIVERTSFYDAVAYAGWNIDIHVPGGFKSRLKPNIHAFFPWVFTIPLRSLYARDLDNLWLVGRDMSVSHVALGATRLQATIGTTGHAVGTAAALAHRRQATPRQIATEHYAAVQQGLLKDGAFIPGVRNTDPDDHALTATVTATSEAGPGFERTRDYLAIDAGRALSFPVTEGHLDRLILPLKNTGAAPATARLYIAACDHPNHATHRAPLAEREVTLSPGEQDLVWEVGLTGLPVGLYAVLVMTGDALEWLRSASAPYGSYTLRHEPQRFFTPNRTTTENLYAVPKLMMMTRDGTPVEWVRQWRNRSQILGRPGQDRSQTPLPFIDIAPKQRPYAAVNVISGVSHTDILPDLWISDPVRPLPQSLELTWDKPRRISSVRLVFDTDLDMPHPAATPVDYLVKRYTVSVRTSAGWVVVAQNDDNRQRFVVHEFPARRTEAVKITVEAVHAGGKSARLFEVRCY